MQTNNGLPASFIYQKQNYKIEEIYDQWRECGQWWLNEEELHVFRVLANSKNFELHHYTQNDYWILYKIAD